MFGKSRRVAGLVVIRGMRLPADALLLCGTLRADDVCSMLD
jgi:hypothetical protein